MLVLTINSGSSSLKYKLFTTENFTQQASGHIDRIGDPPSTIKTESANGRQSRELSIQDHHQAIACMMQELPLDEIMGIGHRIVHGGETFHQPSIIDDELVRAIESLIPLAPLHNPANLAGILACRQQFPQIPQVCVFDTAFHQSMPNHAYRYALPEELYQTHKIRRYGFHGTSHNYVAKQAAKILQQPLHELNIISLHLGNGASACAIANGRSMDTSMGFTPLEGLVMGSRCGDLDPAIALYLVEQGRSAKDIDNLLNKQSGLKGLFGKGDMREIVVAAENGDEAAQLALDVFCYRIKKYIGAYFATLGDVDAIIFTAGIGENAPAVRQRCCTGLQNLGIVLDADKNQKGEEQIQAADSNVKILRIPTNEGAEIAAQTFECIQQRS